MISRNSTGAVRECDVEVKSALYFWSAQTFEKLEDMEGGDGKLHAFRLILRTEICTQIIRGDDIFTYSEKKKGRII
jgi:hypothetical protein